MVIEISNSDLDHIAKACSLIELNCRVFSTEISGILKVRVTDKGKEISPAIAYRLSTCVEQSKRNESERILEQELMQEPKNNVLIMVGKN